MKLQFSLHWLAALFLAVGVSARAAINVPSADGTDGDLILTNSGTPREVVIDLALAKDGNWDTAQPIADKGNGIYDASKWAVVFKYNSVRIETNVTVRFKNNFSRAPVVWLVSSNVLIAKGAALKLDGVEVGAGSGTPQPGPGGFRGSFNAASQAYRARLQIATRLNSNLIPLMGGAGYWVASGGGAILIASEHVVRIDGLLSARGIPNGYFSGGGSIRIVADSIQGVGKIDTTGGQHPGTVRWEATDLLDNSIQSVDAPNFGAVGGTVQLWPSEGSAEVRILKVEEAVAQGDPRAAISPGSGTGGQPIGADMMIRKIGKSKVLIETVNFPPSADAMVMLFATPNSGVIEGAGGRADYYGIRATLQPNPVPSTAKAQWLVEAELPQGYTSLQVHAVAAP